MVVTFVVVMVWVRVLGKAGNFVLFCFSPSAGFRWFVNFDWLRCVLFIFYFYRACNTYIIYINQSNNF